MKVFSLIIMLLMSFHSISYSQEVLLHRNVDFDSTKQINGPNLKFQNNFIIGYGFLVSNFNFKNSNLKYGSSLNFELGFQHKRKISENYSLLMLFSYEYYRYSLKNDTLFNPSIIIYDKKKLRLNNISMTFLNRINLEKRRGNYLGKYFEIGITYQYMFYGNLYYKVKTNINNQESNVKFLFDNVNYIERKILYISSYIGFNKLKIGYKYCLNNILKINDITKFSYNGFVNVIYTI